MQYIIPYLQAREGFQFHVKVWSLGEFDRTKKREVDYDDNNNNKFHFE